MLDVGVKKGRGPKDPWLLVRNRTHLGRQTERETIPLTPQTFLYELSAKFLSAKLPTTTCRFPIGATFRKSSLFWKHSL
jgi:hypothetical protein